MYFVESISFVVRSIKSNYLFAHKLLQIIHKLDTDSNIYTGYQT